MGWRIFKSTDTDAPSTVRNSASFLHSLLRACLIDGYGSVSPVGGWSEPFTTSGDVAVFRADAGNRQFYRISGAATYSDSIQAYEAMSDIDTGSGQWADTYFGKSYNLASAPWVVIANEYTVMYFSIAQYGWCPQMFGEYESCYSSDAYNDMLIGIGNASYLREAYTTWYDTNNFDAYPTNNEEVLVHRLHDGTGLGAKQSIANFFGNKSFSQINTAIYDAYNLDSTKKPVFSPLMIGGYYDSTVCPSGHDYYCKAMVVGRIPIVLACDCTMFDATTALDVSMEWTDPDDSKEYLLLPFGVSTYSSDNRIPIVIPLENLT